MANDVDILLNAIADVESKGTGGYAAKNPKSSATGKYQFLWSQWGDKIKDFAQNPNLTEEEFRANPELQDNYARHYVENVLKPEAQKLQSRHGKKFKNRDVMDLEDAQTLIHFQGYPGSAEYLKTGQTKNIENNKDVRDYLKKTREFRTTARGVNMAAKPIKENDEIQVNLDESQPSETTSQAEAAARGVAQGVSFGFADEITAALESAVTGKPYRQAVEESRKAYETSAKEYPKTTFGAELVGGAATMLIPGVGVVGRTAQTAKAAQAYKAAVVAGDAVAANAAKSVLTKELIRGGAQAGAISGLGGAEDIGKPLETAASVGTGAVVGGTMGYAVPKAVEKVAESKVGKAIGEGVTKAGEFVKEKLKGTPRWQIPEFTTQPEKQARVDEIVKQGKSSGLTDRQILNEIAVEFKELPTESLEQAFQEKGILGAAKRTIAGSQEAAEFIDRPEQMARAERIRKGQTEEMARLQSDIRVGKEAKKTTERELQKLGKVAQEDIGSLKGELADLVDQYKMAENDNVKQNLESKIEYAKERLKLSTGIDKRKEDLARLKEINDQNQKSVQAELEKLNKTRSEEQLRNVAQLRDELNDQVQQLSQQRNGLVESLSSEPASESHIQSVLSLKNELQNTLDEQGMGTVGREALNKAFSGDARYRKLNQWLINQEQQKAYDSAFANQQWNTQKGLQPTDPSARPVDPVILKAGRPPNLPPEQMPSVGDIVGSLYAANQKISSAEYGTPLANVKRRLAETIQERMGDISEEAYALQRQLAQTKAQVSTIEKSPFFEAKAVPIVGKTGRVATGRKAFIKTELPDLSKAPQDYKKELRMIGVNIDEIEKIIDENRLNRFRVSSEETVPGIEQQIAQQEKELGRIGPKYQGQVAERNLQAQELQKQQLQKESELRKKILARRTTAKEAMEPLRAQQMTYEDYLTQLRGQRQQLGETESQLRGTLEETEGVPASMRDVGQAAVIGAKGEVPFGIGKIFVPSPKTRIQIANKIKSRFQNPSLTSAVRVALERPITMEVVRSLAMTHKVSEPELIKEFEDYGIQVQMEQPGMRARELPVELQSKPVSSRVERDKFGNYIIRYNDPNVEDEYFTPEQWARVKSQYE